MSDAAYPYEGRSRLLAAWAALRGRVRAEVETHDSSVSFPELVWAHHERQNETMKGITGGPAEVEYRRRLAVFKRQHGEILQTYWCRYEASGAALTQKLMRRRWTNPLTRDWHIRLHTATDWRTERAPEVAALLYRWETAAIKASEVLRETSERISLQRIFSTCTRLLALVDKPPEQAPSQAALAALAREQKRELQDLDAYYARAGRNSARIVYFRGMVWGSFALAVTVGLVVLILWATNGLSADEERTQALFASIGMGGVGAILSVMTRMASEKSGFDLDYEVGRKSVRFLGALRPWIGALFAFALYLAMRAGLVDLVPDLKRTLYFWATVAFLAGFSERFAKVLIEGALGGSPDDDKAPPPHPTTERHETAI